MGWREFCRHLLFDVPDLATRNLQPAFDAFPWRHDDKALRAWQRGRTGYPIVDAGMRELWHTGVMHNRVRMVVASFLVKHLLIDWREGERWFWDTLVDADAGSNPANWQWVAGSGADAAPYFRVFNPILQGEKFDPDGAYVRRWVPELARLPAPLIHQPWRATPLELGQRRRGARQAPIRSRSSITGKGRERALASLCEGPRELSAPRIALQLCKFPLSSSLLPTLGDDMDDDKPIVEPTTDAPSARCSADAGRQAGGQEEEEGREEGREESRRRPKKAAKKSAAKKSGKKAVKKKTAKKAAKKASKKAAKKKKKAKKSKR